MAGGVYGKLLRSFLGGGSGSSGSILNHTQTPTQYQRFFRSALDSVKNGSSRLMFGQNATSKLQALLINLEGKVNLMSTVVAQQCNRVGALRLRRAYQIILLYQRIYGKQALMQKIKSHIQMRTRPLFFMLSAAIFQWEGQRVTDDELQSCREEIEEVHKLVEISDKQKAEAEVEPCSDSDLLTWEQIIDKPSFKVWRRPLKDSQLFQYRVFGHFTDIPPKAFYNVQVDLEYWKVWDKNTMEVKVVDTDDQTGSQVVHWTYKFPYPMYPRDYVYVRRCKTDPATNTLVVTARSTDHPSCPSDDSCVRVATYVSTMVIQPYTTFDENGFDYVLTYLDDPQTNFPSVCYNWMASTGVHEFLERVHRAARKKQERSSELTTTRRDNDTGGIYANMAHQ